MIWLVLVTRFPGFTVLRIATDQEVLFTLVKRVIPGKYRANFISPTTVTQQ